MEAVATDFVLPPPPSLFIGRKAELQSLERQGKRHRVLFVQGAGGTGKSALVRRWLESSPSPSVCVEIRTGDDLTDALGLLIIALKARPPHRGSADAFLAVMLERAEAVSAVCVIEDLHHWDPDGTYRLLTGVASQARNSRWVFTSREALPPPAGVGLVSLGPLPEAEAHLLAERTGARIEHVADDLTPLAILRAAHRSTSAASAPEDENQRPLLQQLSMVELALSVEDLARLGPLPADEVVRKLTRSGLLVQTPDGYRLHDLARRRIADSLNETERRELATKRADCLSRSERPQSTLEALRAMVTNERVVAAEALSTLRRAALVQAGQGRRLWRLLSQVESAGLRRQAFEVAVAIATQESLHWLQAQPAPAEHGARVCWLNGLVIAGRRQEALRGTLELLESEELSLEERAEAMLLLARIMLKAGAVEEARRQLSKLEPIGEYQRWRGAALEAVASMMVGDLQGALSRARMVRDACISLLPEEALAIGTDIEPIWLELGDAADTKSEVDPSATASNRQMQALRAMAMSAKANPAGAKLLVEAMTRGANASPEERAKVHLAAAGISVAVGDMAGLARHLEITISSARESQDWHTYQWTMGARASFAWLAGWPQPVLPWDISFKPPAGIHALNLRSIAHLAALEAGQPSPYITAELCPDGLTGEMAALAQFTQSVAFAIEGEFDTAAMGFERSIARARAGGWAAYELFGLLGSSGIHLMRRDRTALVAAASQFHERVVGSGVELACTAAQYFVEASQTHPQLEVIVSIADAGARAPRQANWAKAILGLEEPRGRLAQLIVDGTRYMWGQLRILHIPAPGSPSLGWGVDTVGDTLWLPGASKPIALRRRAHFKRFIEYLAANGGSATMEELAKDVWDVEEYHSIRDGNRIRVAVGRYRELIGDQREAPRRLVTVDGGYAFGTEEPVTIAWRPPSN